MKSQIRRKYKVEKTLRLVSLAATLGLASCAGSGGGTIAGGEQNHLFAENPQNFRLSLTDAPNDDLKKVIVKVHHAELRLQGGGKEARVIVAENLGDVDLLTLQNGVTLPMADISIPENVSVSQIRLVLENEGNHIIRSDDSRCDLATPSAQQTGIKFIIHQGITVEKGYSYSIVADFDAKKSIVLQGNGGCLLKPVLKLKSASRVAVDPQDPVDGSASTPENLAGDSDSTQSGDESGFDSGNDPGTPVVQPGDVPDYFDM